MNILEIIKAGNFLNHYENNDTNFRLSSMIDSLIAIFYEANQSLNLFDSEYNNRSSSNINEWEIEREERREIENDLISKITHADFYKNYESNNFEVEIRYNRNKHEKGILPETLKRKNIFIFAKSFLFSLDNFQKTFKSILDSKEFEYLPILLGDLYQEFCHHFSDLREVRNSAHHFEDRIQGKKFGKKIKLKPISNDFIKADNGALILNQLTNRRFGNTLGSGYFGEVEVSLESMILIQQILQKVIDNFKWEGHKEYHPR